MNSIHEGARLAKKTKNVWMKFSQDFTIVLYNNVNVDAGQELLWSYRQSPQPIILLCNKFPIDSHYVNNKFITDQ